MSGSPPKGSSISQSSTLENSRNACSRGRPLMLITISVCSQTSGEILLDSRPSTPYPFLMSVCLVNPTTKPSGAKPALNASIASGASRRAIASAIGLRQAFPMQTNKTFVRPSFLLIRRFLSKLNSCRLGGLVPRIASGMSYSCSGRLQEPPYETHAIPVLYRVQSGKALIGPGGQLWQRARNPRFRRPVLLCKYRLQICRYSALRRTLSIHTVPAIWLSNLLETGRIALTSSKWVSAEVVNSACCSDQPEVPTRFSVDTKRWPGL